MMHIMVKAKTQEDKNMWHLGNGYNNYITRYNEAFGNIWILYLPQNVKLCNGERAEVEGRGNIDKARSQSDLWYWWKFIEYWTTFEP